jgi:ribosomal protein L6P/L9E
MSRVAKRPVPLPENVEFKLATGELKVKGPKGELVDLFTAELRRN